MPRIAATTGGAEETERLMVLMAERITQALARNEKLFRKGRGQMTDFAERYGLMATTAKRILSGTAYPTHVLLLALSKDCEVPVDWFFGGGHFNIDDEVEHSTVEVPIYGQQTGMRLPRAGLRSISEDSDFLAIEAKDNEWHPLLSKGDYGLFALTDTPCLRDPPCAVVFGGNPDAVRLAAISFADPRGESYVVSVTHSPAETFRAAQVVFGEGRVTKAGVRVLGPLVGRVCFDGFDPIGFPLVATGAKRKTPRPRSRGVDRA